MTRISVVVPVGPLPHHRRWLEEALVSIARQDQSAFETILVDDMAGLDPEPLVAMMAHHASPAHMGFVLNDWRLGVAASFNIGVANAFERGAELAFMLGSDDWIDPPMLGTIVEAYDARTIDCGGVVPSYMWVDVTYSDGRGDQAVPCGAAAVNEPFWRETGGFWPESGVGTSDANLISAMMVHRPHYLARAAGGPYYHHRVHEGQDTGKAPAWQGPILSTRNLLTQEWRPQQWGR